MGNLRYLDGISASVQEVVCSAGNIRVNIMEVCFLLPTFVIVFQRFCFSPDSFAFETCGRGRKARVLTLALLG